MAHRRVSAEADNIHPRHHGTVMQHVDQSYVFQNYIRHCTVLLACRRDEGMIDIDLRLVVYIRYTNPVGHNSTVDIHVSEAADVRCLVGEGSH